MSHLPNAVNDRRHHSVLRKWLACVRVPGSQLVGAHWNMRKQKRLPPAGKVIDWPGAFQLQGRVRPVRLSGCRKGLESSRRCLKRPYQFLQTFVLDDTRHTHTLLPLAVVARARASILDHFLITRPRATETQQ